MCVSGCVFGECLGIDFPMTKYCNSRFGFSHKSDWNNSLVQQHGSQKRHPVVGLSQAGWSEEEEKNSVVGFCLGRGNGALYHPGRQKHECDLLADVLQAGVNCLSK